MKACEAIVTERRTQLEQCQSEFLKQLKVAREQQTNIKAKCGSRLGSDQSYFETFIRATHEEGVGDADAREMILELFEKAGIAVPKLAPKAIANGEKSSSWPANGRPQAKGKQVKDDNLKEAEKEMVWEHREHTHELRKLLKELVARVRSLRFFEAVRDLQMDRHALSSSDKRPIYECPHCEKKDIPVDDLGILSACGHKGCLDCVKKCATEREACVNETGGCKSLSRMLSVVEARTLGVDDVERDGKGRHFGRKLEQMIDLIK